MEMVSSSLDKLLTNSGGRAPLALPVAVDIMLQISRGMEYLHSQGIMHMDLKSSNVLIEPSAVPQFGKRGYGRVKLCDFGMASLRLSSFRCEDPKGTCYWRAPEAFPFPNEKLLPEIDTLEEYTYKADVYSFEMTCYEILTGKQPFLNVHPKDQYRLIVQGRRPNLQPPSCPPVLADYIAKCSETNPKHRPRFAQISSFLRNMKLFILSGNDPPGCGRYFIPPEVSFKEEGFDESPADEKMELINRVLHTVRPEIKRRYNINMAGSMPSEKSNAQKDHPLPVFLNMRDCFHLRDVFRSTEEVLGKGRFKSSTHRANLRDFFLVVKKLSKDTTYLSDKRYFRRLFQVLGSVKHLNLRSLPFFQHVSEEEKLLIYNNGTLYSLLHTKRKPLKWDKRMKIAVNVAAWLAFLHKSGTPHGNVNSSNILLDEDGNACLADSCSSGIVRNSSVAEYMAPEQDVTGKICQESDVYSFGVLLVELFTGRNPASPAITGLPNSRTEVSDMMLMGYRRTIETIRGMLAVAMLSSSHQIYTRPLMSDVVKMIHALQNSNRFMLPPIRDSFLSPSELLSRLCPSELLSRVYRQLPDDSIEDGMGKLELEH